MGKPQVTLTLAGDASKLEQVFDSVGQSSKQMAGDVGKSSKDVGESFDRAGEAADNVDTKAMGFRDTLTGVQDTMSGTAMIAQGDLFNGFLTLGAGVGDLASGFFNLLIPLGKTAILKGFAAAQWLINAAMSANPIGLVVIALALLVAGFVIAWKKSETFRDVVKKALDAVKKAFWWLVDGFGKAWKAVGEAWGKFAAWVGGWKDSITKRVSAIFSAIGSAFGTAWRAVGDAWSRFVDWINGWKQSITSRVGSLFSGIASAFGAVWKTMGDAWSRFAGWIGGWKKALSFSGMFDGIMTAAKSAFNWLIGKWNSLSFSLPSVDTHIPGVGTIGGWTLSTPNLPYFHTGGIVPGGLGSESLAVLRAGERVTGGRNSAGGTTIVFKSDGSRTGKLLLQILREAIRIEGGDVQVVLGQ